MRRPRADITVVLTLDELERRDPGISTGLRVSRRGLSRATLDRITCDCNIARVITAGPSQVLDVGRATSVWPEPIRRAIEVRDGGCTTCGRAPEYCDIHHVTPRHVGGKTSVDNGECKCRHCHVNEHEGNRGPPR